MWNRKQNCRGVSLVEAAIGMAIFGLLMATAIDSYNNYKKSRLINDSIGNISVIKSAVNRYYLKEGKYPCPARADSKPGDADYGVSFCPPVGTPAPDSCSGTICRATGALGGQVLIGSVPFVTLDTIADYGVDGWGRKLGYAVTESQVSVASFSDALGEIRVRKADGVTPLDKNAISGLERYAHFILVSFGNDGRGGYNVEGKQALPCGATGIDPENCDNDANFRWDVDARIRILNDAANYFDDFLGTQYFLPQTLWKVAPNAADFLTNTSNNIGIGTNIPTQKLEVNGNVGASETLSRRYCIGSSASSIDDCFAVENFMDVPAPGSKNISCPGYDKGEAMTGIKNGKAVCQLSAPAGLNATCPAGQFLTAINAGVPVCQTP